MKVGKDGGRNDWKNERESDGEERGEGNRGRKGRATTRLQHASVIHHCLISPIERVDGMLGKGYSNLLAIALSQTKTEISYIINHITETYNIRGINSNEVK